jgi:hypothetical protein
LERGGFVKDVIVLIPGYKPRLSPAEYLAMRHVTQLLAKRDVFFMIPGGMDTSEYRQRIGDCRFIEFDPAYFTSVPAYSNLLINPNFYQRFGDYEWVLIMQMDVLLLRDDLDRWLHSPYDYIGAPWSDGFEFPLNGFPPFVGEDAMKLNVYVGNGGFSLRRIKPAIKLLNTFAPYIATMNQSKMIEDFIFAVFGLLLPGYNLPNQITASLFAMEAHPSYYFTLNGGQLPMGVHAWQKWDINFWRKHFPKVLEWEQETP